ncbi:MAG: hypothetical protein HXN40_10295 [Prevotella histicola]|mgnify:CR=1 FL=1|uniref:hypothetical protein n=2 Tax=Prevotella histicola TaxID=470565 RepID=UPI001CB5243C|nr:hypothetical protein [Prevotella histicola]MBF1423949.1 hypothetical protein [Prevotella histicola]
MNTFIKRTTIGSVMQGLCYGFAALLFAASCANDDTVQEGKQKENNIPAGATVFTGTSQSGTTTRTAILNHTKGSGASVNWSSSDKIWVKDDAGTWQQSGAAVFPFTNNSSFAKFGLSGTYTGASHDILYTNKAITGSQPQVEIKATQTQSAPNNFDHAGESGDCGIATASRVGSGYNFTLNHKASYLCFIPRSSNPYVNRSKLIKIEIMCDDDIAGTYNMAADGTLTLASGGSKTITVTTGSGFAIDNSTEDMSKNATYAVVAPGTHTFRIRYWLRNTTDYINLYGWRPSDIEGTISKYVTINCTAGSIHDVTANLDLHDYDGDHYCMWDAQQQYWADHSNTQPKLNGQNSNDYPQDRNDASHRWYHVSSGPLQASQLCAAMPNVNEMTWYAAKGDPRWDKDELWTTMGHLYKGGMWFKKKSVLQVAGNYNANIAADGSDWRTNAKSMYRSPLNMLPSVADASDYFYLPAVGQYSDGKLIGVGSNGAYWSSSALPYDQAYVISFGDNLVAIGYNNRFCGFAIGVFE